MRAILLSLLPLVLLGLSACSRSDGQATQPAATNPTTNGATMSKATATFAAGCFWGVEETFRKVPGVINTTVGYTGGRMARPTYQDVCGDETGHAEAIQIEYDPAKVSYEQLLDIFWANHNPTTLNRQGPDEGSQYRSAVFYHSPEQKAAAEASKAKLEASHRYKRPIVTEIVEAGIFWPAEEYHQKYLLKHGRTFCHVPEADER